MGYQAPKVFAGQYYDARAADIWSLGMILFQCITNESLFVPSDMWQEPKHGYWALKNNKLKKHLSQNNMLRLFNRNSLSLLESLLNIDEKKRFKAAEVLKHSWFGSYYKKYSQRIKRKVMFDTQRIQNQAERMSVFPYYNLR